MKFKLLFVALLCAFTAYAQTSKDTNGLPAFTDTVSLSGLGAIGKTIGQQIADTHFNLKDGISVSPFGLYHKGDIGAGVSVHTMNTNGLRLGLALAGVNEHDVRSKTIFNSGPGHWDFYDASLSIGGNGTFHVPVLDWDLDLYLETGPAFNLVDLNTIYLQSVAGATKSFRLGGGKVLTVGGGVGHLTKPGWENGPFYIAHAGLSF